MSWVSFHQALFPVGRPELLLFDPMVGSELLYRAVPPLMRYVPFAPLVYNFVALDYKMAFRTSQQYI